MRPLARIVAGVRALQLLSTRRSWVTARARCPHSRLAGLDKSGAGWWVAYETTLGPDTGRHNDYIARALASTTFSLPPSLGKLIFLLVAPRLVCRCWSQCPAWSMSCKVLYEEKSMPQDAADAIQVAFFGICASDLPKAKYKITYSMQPCLGVKF